MKKGNKILSWLCLILAGIYIVVYFAKGDSDCIIMAAIMTGISRIEEIGGRDEIH